MSNLDTRLFSGSDGKTIPIEMYETGGEEGSGFHMFNVATDQYHRAEVLQRTGAIDITCSLEKVVYGAISADSNNYACLVVIEWFFQPKGSRRISEATIELLFESDTANDAIEVQKISFLGTYDLMPTKQDESITRGINATVGIQQFSSLGLGGKWEKTTTKTVLGAIKLSGRMQSPNNRAPNRIAKWTISENRSQPTGIPASLKLAVLVSSKNREIFRCRLAFTCQTDRRTAAQSFFKNIPKDDPVMFQPDSSDRGTRPNRNVVYGDNELGSVNLDELGGVTLRTTVPCMRQT